MTTEVAPVPAPPVEPDRPPHRSRGTVVFPVVVVAVIAVTIALCLVMTRDDGADTPEAALHELIDAAEAGDAVGVLDALPPAERRALADGVVDLSGQLGALGLIDVPPEGTADLPTVHVDDLIVSTTPFGEDVAAVDLIGGTLTIQLGPGDGQLLTDAGQELLATPSGSAPDGPTTITRDLALEPIRLIAIDDGGGWHISLNYSVVDALVADGGIAVPEMGTGPFPFGAATAEDAVVDLFRAYADGYVDRMVTVLASDEARSLYDYAPVFAPITSARIDDLRARGEYDVQLNSISTEVEGAGDTRTVRVTGLNLDIRDQVRKMHLEIADGCLRVDHRIDDDDAPYETYEVCDGDWDDPDATSRPLEDPVGNAAIFGGGADLPPFTVVERNGRWFVSPVRTLFDSVVGTLDGLAPDQQRAFLDRLVRSAEAGVGEGLIGSPLAADLSPEARAAELIARCDALLPDAPLTTAPVSPPDGSGSAAPDGGAVVTAETQAAAVRRACVDRLVRTGSIAWDAIPEDRRGGLTPPPAA